MRIKPPLSVLLLFLLVPASITRAQTISSQKGLTTAVFNLPQGKVTAYIPVSMGNGEQVTVGFRVDPAGNNEKQRSNALDELLKSELRAGDPNNPTLSLAQHYNQDTRSGLLQPVIVTSVFVVSLIDSKKQTQTVPIEIKTMQLQTMDPGSGCTIPTHALTGSPLQITGPFDGDASNTKCSLDNKPLNILAESPRQCIVSYPQDAKGIQTLNIQESGRQGCLQNVSAVNMILNTGKLNLRKGESTWVECTITGLEGLKEPARLAVNNVSTGVVLLGGGNTQWYILVTGDDEISEYDTIPPLWWETWKTEPMPWQRENIKNDQDTWQKRWDVQSLKTGSFNINFDLDCPPGPYYPGMDTKKDSFIVSVPPGQTAKKCNCTNTASITQTSVIRKNVSYHATVRGDCTGVCGVGTGTFIRCQLQSITYEWIITKGGDQAVIVGSAGGPDVTVRLKDNAKGGIFLQLNATTICKDCNRCTTTIGKFITVPTEPPKPDTLNKPPDIDVDKRKTKCKCGCTVVINQTGANSREISLAATVIAGCNGFWGDPPQKCALKSINYHWQPKTSNIKIKGVAGNAGVALSILNTGHYSVFLYVDVQCIDGTGCESNTFFDGDIPEMTNECELLAEERTEPKMDGGLKSKYITSGKQIRRNDLIALGAEGLDFDWLKWTCQPRTGCTDTKSEKTILLNSRVRFEWTILAGNGSFAIVGSLPGNIKTAEGDNIIFKPPDLPLPVKKNDTADMTTIKLSVIDDNPTQPQDAQVDRTITIIVKRSRGKPDFYSVDIRSEKYSLPGIMKVPGITGTCITIGPDWEMADGLTKPLINLPVVAGKDKIMPGQWIVLSTDDQRDKDNLTINCNSKNKCKTGPWSKTYEDKVIWTWSIVSGGGKIISDPGSRFIIYEAPTVMPIGKDFIEVKIHVKITNAGGKINDKESEGEIVFKVNKPG